MALPRKGTTGSSDGEWIFFPNCDSYSGDIGQVASLIGPGRFGQQRSHAEQFNAPRCVAFNTNGWFKHKIAPREGWTRFGGNGDGMWVRRSAVEALEWEFFPGMDSSQNDIEHAEEFSGNNSQLMHYANTNFPDCVAFNTNGWIKHSVRPREEWTKWSETVKFQGLWVKKSALEALDWVFIQGMDSAGNDIEVNSGTAEQLKKTAISLRENCVAFNTNGWLKFALEPRASWVRWTSDENKGMWVKRSALQRLGWEFLPGVDSPGNDLEQAVEHAGDVSALFSYVENFPDCVAFNTNGWLKNKIGSFVSFGRSPFQGLWVKSDQQAVKDRKLHMHRDIPMM